MPKKEQRFCECTYREFGIGGICEYDVLWPFKEVRPILHNVALIFEKKKLFDFCSCYKIYKDEMKENFQWPEGEDLITHQLVSVDDFTDDYSRSATCAYINIIPVWKSIAVGPSRRIEQYVRCATAVS